MFSSGRFWRPDGDYFGETMIQVTKLDNTILTVNSDMIEFIESTPDTIMTLTDGKKIIVCESPDRLIDLIVEFRQRVMKPMHNQGNVEE
jgi:flagellar protein FlbD